MQKLVKYLMAIRKYGENNTAEVCIVPKDYWDNNKRMYPTYIPDAKLADSMESLGFIECMENTFEFKTTKYSVDEATKIVLKLGNIEYSKEFESFINNY